MFPSWYDRLLGTQMSDGGVRGVLVAHSDATMYGLKFSGSKKLALVTVEQALRARRIQLDGCSITLEDRGTGILRTLQGPTDLSSSPSTAGTCVVEWTTATTPPSEVPFTDVLDHVVDAFLGVSLQKTYDYGITYTLTLAKPIVYQGALHYQANFHDEDDVDFLSKEYVLQALDPDDMREVVVPVEDVMAPPPVDRPPIVHVRFHSQSLHMTLGQTTDGPISQRHVCVYELLPTADGSQGEASASGLVEIGDMVVRINGTSVAGFDVHRIATIISQTPRPIQLSFQKKRDPGRSFPETKGHSCVLPFVTHSASPLERALATANGWSALLLDLREAIASGHNVGVDGSDVVFSTDESTPPVFRLPASTCTGFRSRVKSSADAAPLTLGTVAMYVRHRHLSYAEYARRCRAAGSVGVLSIVDINALLPFLNGRDDPPRPPQALGSNHPIRPHSPDKGSTHTKTGGHERIVDNDAAMSPTSSKPVAAVPVTPTKGEGGMISKGCSSSSTSSDDDERPVVRPPKKLRHGSTLDDQAQTKPLQPVSQASSCNRVVTLTVHDRNLGISMSEGKPYPIVNALTPGGPVEASGLVAVGAQLTHVRTTHVARATVVGVVDLIRIIPRPATFTFINPPTLLPSTPKPPTKRAIKAPRNQR
ncbi:hypothetical protein DYB25_007021 [Aphanomyces astaci]|uniref:PDZ domain-containing protein n=2 Tax=Aphanomyces astaci TaxID=112090 RepID=A0A396ZPJ8_APHAT|nr:hypothetical protein DYB25_007021 [Aphanomyces astaci]